MNVSYKETSSVGVLNGMGYPWYYIEYIQCKYLGNRRLFISTSSQVDQVIIYN